MRRPIIVAITAFFFAATTGPSAQAPSAPANAPAQSPISSGTMKVKTRLITVDVVATDSHGEPIRGLKKEDFQIFEEHNREQQIVRFEFVDRAANAAANGSAQAATSPARTLFSNELASDKTIAPTVLLLDALNTDTVNQSQVRPHMLALLKTLPLGTPIAVFSLGHTLHVIQNFSTDPKILRAAVDRALRPMAQEQNPQDDPNSASNFALDQNGGTETSQIQGLEDFESQMYEAQMAIRVDETTDAMVQVAKYLGGYSGRKNLIWFSEAFPSWLAPSADFGTDAFIGSASYSDKIRKASEALTDAQVSVYPVDATGLAPAQLYSAAQNPHINQQNPGAGFAAQLNRQNGQHLDSQATMDAVAEETGGKTCKNTNDLSGCVQSAINDGATFYELAYYPEGIAWDGLFHKITVKTTQRGARLSYRHGYFAVDTQALARQQRPEDLLRQACIDPLPSTSIALTVQPVALQGGASQAVPAAQAEQAKYLLTVSPAALTFVPQGDVRQMNLQVAICEYDAKGDTFAFFAHDLSRSVPDATYQNWQQNGFRSVFDYAAKAEDQRLRFAIVDVPTGDTASVDVPAHPLEFASMPPGVAPAGAPLSVPPPAAPALRTVTTKFNFKSSSGKASALDWSSGTVTYNGDLSVEVGASAFFQKLVGGQYHCESGSLVSNDPKSTTPPRLGFLLESPMGLRVLVDMTGAEPQYTGSLPVDADAKAFFGEVWKFCHCQQP